MLRTVEAVVESDGSLRLLENVDLRVGDRALVTLLGEDDARAENAASETALLSEASLAEDWNRDEEDDAWAHLQ